ncbi:MAG: GIY-YIG nuclease family protein [Candidatus Omnitrophica bacterium]|nr:GIY-YIG nuclease family protein [Candidatus Omnitrophota bacterium]
MKSPRISQNKKNSPWFLYILETKNGKLYTGITNNIERRMKAHKTGRGARFTRNFGFKKLLYSEGLNSQAEAMRKEREVKTWPRKKKIELAGIKKRKSASKLKIFSRKQKAKGPHRNLLKEFH